MSVLLQSVTRLWMVRTRILDRFLVCHTFQSYDERRSRHPSWFAVLDSSAVQHLDAVGYPRS